MRSRLRTSRVLAGSLGNAKRGLSKRGGTLTLSLFLTILLFGDFEVARGQPASAPASSPAVQGDLVQVAREFVAFVEASDRDGLSRSISFARWYEAEVAGDEVDRAAYVTLPERDRRAWREGLLSSLLEGRLRAQFAGRMPGSGGVESRGPSEARVWLNLRPQSGGAEERGVFRLSLDGTKWKVYGVGGLTERSLEGVETVVLADGSVAYEGKIEPKDHLPDTPPALRARIDSLVAVLLDPGKTKEVGRARRELAQIGKPAIPRLLNALATTPMGIEENDVLLNIVSETLSDITGTYTSFAPRTGEGSLASEREERRRSGLKQWFGWWEKNRATFPGPGAASKPTSRPS